MPTPRNADRKIQPLIDHQPELDAACGLLAGQRELPMDTEFVRTDTYRPKLCLIQAAAAGEVFCVDTLAPLDFSAFRDCIASPGTLKIMHSAKQDIEALLLHFGDVPGPLFDTQIAAGLLGHPPQAGYATLVESELGIRLDKSQTRTDWSRRPLTPAQIEYACDDVAYLTELSQRLRARLASRGRESWALDDSAALLDPAQYRVRPEQAWERLSGIRYQLPEVQARARRLAAWRESRAEQSNRPRQWILSDQAIMALSGSGPADLDALRALDVMPPGALRNSGEAVLAQMRQAEADLAGGALDLKQQDRPALPDNNHLKRLAAVVKKVAGGLDIAPEILATRSDLSALLQGSRDVRPLKGWRQAVLGEALLAAL